MQLPCTFPIAAGQLLNAPDDPGALLQPHQTCCTILQATTKAALQPNHIATHSNVNPNPLVASSTALDREIEASEERWWWMVDDL